MEHIARIAWSQVEPEPLPLADTEAFPLLNFNRATVFNDRLISRRMNAAPSGHLNFDEELDRNLIQLNHSIQTCCFLMKERKRLPGPFED